MSVLELVAPLLVMLDPSGEDVHFYCCDRDKALCGEDLSGRPDLSLETPATCVPCIELDEQDVRCGALFCRTRQRLRGER